MSFLTAAQAVEHLNRARPAGTRRALGYRRFLRLCATGRGPRRVTFGDDGPGLFDTADLDAWAATAERAA